MSVKSKTILLVVLALLALGSFGYYLDHASIPVLQPRGPIGQKEKNLIVIAVLLSLIVVIPVYAMLIGFAWRYREGNKKAKYSPDFSHSRWLEGIWWAVPLAIISLLAVITWKSSHELDPFRNLSSQKPALTIQVVALQWKWLFIYPRQNIAAVNYVQFPVDTPVNFEITSDAPMNSFWIPQLGGQIYAMSGMSTHLHLMADQTGIYRGSSANISGRGFAGMNFNAQASDNGEFSRWVGRMHNNPDHLDRQAYGKLAEPSQNNPVAYYGSAENDLYNSVVNKYLAPVYFKPAAEAR
jgi:cytochrome o ubiquinol oxidase subunit 2